MAGAVIRYISSIYIETSSQMTHLAEAVDAAVCDVALRDMQEGKSEADIDSRRRYICGASMGGFTALYYSILFPPAPTSEAAESAGIRKTFNGVKRPKITGAMFLCPMIEVAPESRPSVFVEYFARAIAYFAGRLPLAEANRGKNTTNLALEEECRAEAYAS